MKTVLGILLAVAFFVLGMVAGDKVAAIRVRSEIAKLKSENAICKSESERLSGIIRQIKQTVTEATPVEKAK